MWQRPFACAATSMPVRPGHLDVEKEDVGRTRLEQAQCLDAVFGLARRSASSGQSAASDSRSSSRRCGSSSAIAAVGWFIGNLQDRLRAAALRRAPGGTAASSPYSANRRSPMSSRSPCSPPGTKPAPLSVIARRSLPSPTPRLDPDRAPGVRRLQAVDQGMVDQRQQHHRRHARVRELRSGMTMSKASRSPRRTRTMSR